MKVFYVMLVLVPLAVAAELMHASYVVVFMLSALALIPLAALLGKATEDLAVYTGPRVGGLLNATLGNAAELIISLVALQAGLVALVKASITGSILGNLLVVLGASLLVGGLKNGVQRFSRAESGMAAAMMMLAVIALVVPSFFSASIEASAGRASVQYLSDGVAIVMILLYLLYLAYSFFSVKGHSDESDEEHHGWSLKVAVGTLIVTTLAVIWMSEILVGAVEPMSRTLGWSELFVGVMIIPLVGNIAEHIVGVQVAYKNKMNLSLSISLGSSMQVALFVAPVLVFAGLLTGQRMDLVFTRFEILALVAAVLIGTIVSVDGESNWLEGAQLLAVYVILGIAFYILPVA